MQLDLHSSDVILQLVNAQRGIQAAEKDMIALAQAKSDDARKHEAKLAAQREVGCGRRC